MYVLLFLVSLVPRFYLPFAFTIIHGIGRSAKNFRRSMQTEGKNGGGLGMRLIFSAGGKFQPVSNFTELHALVARSCALLACSVGMLYL